jgi:hypothetical protein
MTKNKSSLPQKLFVLLVFLAAILACNLTGQAHPTEAPPPAAPPTQALETKPPQALPTTAVGGAAGAIRQWAFEAEASSEYGSTDWAASQATGTPNTPNCGDVGTAWAASKQDTREWINLYYTQPVVPTEIHIIETYYPNQVVQVDLIDMQGQFVTIYTGEPKQVDSPCPFILSIPVNKGDLLVQGLRITIDQSVIQNWNEIDAVELVGVPGNGTPVRPTPSNP